MVSIEDTKEKTYLLFSDFLKNNKIISGLSILIVVSLIGRINNKEKDVINVADQGKFDSSEARDEKKVSIVNEFEGIPLTADLDLWKNECQPQDGLIYLKKHKTASTTFKDIAEKWLRIIGAKKKVEPPMIGPQSGCFPAKFNEKCWGNNQRQNPVLAMVDHYRWNMDYLPSIFDPNRSKVKTFTTIRDPLSTFRSAYNYFFHGKEQRCEFGCWGYPFKQFFASSSLEQSSHPTIEEFLDILPKVFNASTPFSFRVSNAQSFELGMDFDKINDMKYVKESLARLDRQFDLILITEHFWEGIVLLKHMLCADYRMLYKESTNSRDYVIEPLNAERQAIFDKFHETDTLMYNYFNASLHRKIEAFGHEVYGIGACANSGHPYINAKHLYETGTWNYLNIDGNPCDKKILEQMELDTKVPLTTEFKEKYNIK
ncbi:unnamed protein product [Oikopleura dioica]|uniref:Sulfotransferase n=1 Tax=Oikopleura dioica TaxID=34765 RepID=E4Y8G9_OIKDI|nr:unnamed protein product [Oikopleura dioica]